MKTIAIILLVLTAVVLACKGQQPEGDSLEYRLDALASKEARAASQYHAFAKNPTLPADAVELMSEYVADQFYQTKPTERPSNLTPTEMLTRVFIPDPPMYIFVGWLWMEAADVTELHKPEE